MRCEDMWTIFVGHSDGGYVGNDLCVCYVLALPILRGGRVGR